MTENPMPTTRLAVLSLLLLAAPATAEVLHPAKIPTTAVEATLDGPTAVAGGKNGTKTKWVEMLHSADKKLSAGIYSATASRNEIASYHVDEFMYFIKGGVTLTSADGTVTEIVAGDGVTIPKGWKGVWDTKGYTKYYVTYETADAAK
jgi:ethanolamine utilization protein EutQ